MRMLALVFLMCAGAALGNPIGSVVSPTDFGAYGDGFHDDSVAFQKALDTGKSVLCKPGLTFLVGQLKPVTGSRVVGRCTLNARSGVDKGLFYAEFKNFTIDGPRFNGYPGIYLVYAAGVRGLVIQNTHVHRGGIANVVDRNGGPSTDIAIMNNVASGPGASGVFQAIQIVMSQRWKIEGNKISSYGHGIQWWGGNAADVTGGAAAGKVRAVRQGTITGNMVSKVAGGAIWGSMGADISITTNTVSNFGDVGIDNEGGTNITVTGNTVFNNACTQPGGGIAAFFLVSNYVVSGNRITSSRGCPAFAVHNDPSHRSPGPIVISSNRFSESDGYGSALLIEQISDLAIKDNHMFNTTLQLGSYGYRKVAVEHNSMKFDIDSGQWAMKLVNPASTGGLMIVKHNTIQTNKLGAASEGILLCATDSSSLSNAQVTGNRVKGFPISIHAVDTSPNPAVGAIYNIHSNYVSGEVRTGVLTSEASQHLCR